MFSECGLALPAALTGTLLTQPYLQTHLGMLATSSLGTWDNGFAVLYLTHLVNTAPRTPKLSGERKACSVTLPIPQGGAGARGNLISPPSPGEKHVVKSLPSTQGKPLALASGVRFNVVFPLAALLAFILTSLLFAKEGMRL